MAKANPQFACLPKMIGQTGCAQDAVNHMVVCLPLCKY